MRSLAELEVTGKQERSISNLPCLGSRAILAGWYSVVDEALRASDHNKVLKLFEAALCIPLRLRLAPTRVQVALGSITYAEDLYAVNGTNSDAFVIFAEKAIAILPEGFLANNSAKIVVQRCIDIGISFHGSAIGDNIARALKNVAPFVNSADFQIACSAFEEIREALDDQTNISSVCFA